MPRKTYTTNQLTPGSQILVRGKVAYSHILSHIAGDELARDIQRRQAAGRTVIEKPYTTISVYDAKVVYQDPNAYQNPNLRRPEEVYIDESMYKSNGKFTQGLSLSMNNKSSRLPWIATATADGKVVEMPDAPGELATELDVTLVLRVFSAPRNNGVSIDGVIINETPRFFNGANRPDLAAYGLTFVGAPAGSKPATPAPAPATNAGATPAAPVQPPVGDPFSTPAPVQPAAPVQATGAVTPAAPAAAGGIAYDPAADPGRRY